MNMENIMTFRPIKIIILSILTLILIFATSCSGNPKQTATAEILPTATLMPSKTPEPTKTPTEIPTETMIPTPEDTPTKTPLPGPDFSNAEIFSMGPMENWNFFFTIQIEEEITGSYYAMVDKNKKYKCFMMDEYPNRLYCHGPQVAFNDYVEYELYMEDVDDFVHAGEFFIPLYLPTAK